MHGDPPCERRRRSARVPRWTCEAARRHRTDPTLAGRPPIPVHAGTPVPCCRSPAPFVTSYLFESVPDPVERLDHVEVVVDLLELLAQPLDMAVDGAIVHVDLIIV